MTARPAHRPAEGRAAGQRPEAPEPLPHPVVDNHCHLDIAATTTGRRCRSPRRSRGRPRSACPGSCRSAATCPARAGRSRPPRRTTPIVAGVALHPNEAPAARRAGRRSTRRSPRSRSSPAHERVRAVGETGLDYFRTGPDGRAAQDASFRRAHRAGQAARQDPGHPRPRRPRRRAAGPRRGGRAGALGDALLLRRRRRSPGRAWTAAPTSPSPAR